MKKIKNLFYRESEVEKFVEKHVELVGECYEKLKLLMENFYEGNYDEVEKLAKKISELEREADEVRRKMELKYYSGAFLPFDREDRILLTEKTDKIADTIESVAFSISLSKIRFPKILKKNFREFIDAIDKTLKAFEKSMENLDKDYGEAIKKAHETEKLEENADKVERKIIKKLFKLYKNKKIGTVKLLGLKEITTKLGHIADQAEDASDRVLIIAAKIRG
ncbi:Putative phosphate transport regulator [Methanothermus fervidus DSM 2088]|uniref:Putative phosphate transport regulator n=1 Tax=Methanothermus fervidus (strain ATCC 43054 / DSM 2088 / JCM 10308 / V24 S) TaxID=523846 RepID=E3GZ18_METFV|nr:TIGR00153 family protein [Methanothermus fervidus]ADP77550.1 Putative phosphate transport regulator [Methanothermus fervidus DSM 2088]